jgi:hypothetical protein
MKTFKTHLQLLFFPLAVIAFTTIIFGFYIYTTLYVHRLEALQPYLDWSVPRPFVYRALTTLAIQGVSAGFSISPELASLAISYLALLGFAWAFWYLAIRFLPTRRAQQMTLLAPLTLCPLFLVQRQIYDFPTLFLFTLALALLAHEKFFGYLLLLPLVCLTKETALLLIFFFAFHFRAWTRQYAILLGVQLWTYAATRFSLMWIFRNSAGSDLEFHLIDQIHFYSANPAFALLLLGFVVAVIALAAYQFSAKPKFLRDAVLTIGIPLAVLFIFFGFPFELRVFFEAHPALLLVCVPPSLS